MMTRRVLVPSVEIERVLNLAQERGLTLQQLQQQARLGCILA
jgi:hypothetical protein